MVLHDEHVLGLRCDDVRQSLGQGTQSIGDGDGRYLEQFVISNQPSPNTTVGNNERRTHIIAAPKK